MIPFPTIALLALQSPGPDSSAAVLLDCAAAQAGDDLITLSELNRANELLLKNQPVSTQEEAQKLSLQGLRELLTARLEAQAGEDMGLDPAQVSQQIRWTLEQEREEIGLTSYTEKLLAEGRDAKTAEEDRIRQLYVLLWRRSRVGYPVAGKRPAFDRFVRPGELSSFYDEHRAELWPVRVRLRLLVVPSAAAGGPEQARATCEDVRERVIGGEDLGALVEEFGALYRDTRGLLPYLPVPGIPDPALREFAEKSGVGELSAPMPLINKTGQPDPSLGFQLVQLEEREEGRDLEFESAELQQRLRDFFTDARTRRVLEREQGSLRAAAYSWIHPRLRGFAGAEGAERR